MLSVNGTEWLQQACDKQNARGMTACAGEKKVCNFRYFKNAFIH